MTFATGFQFGLGMIGAGFFVLLLLAILFAVIVLALTIAGGK